MVNAAYDYAKQESMREEDFEDLINRAIEMTQTLRIALIPIRQ